jgi:hypothetical protein
MLHDAIAEANAVISEDHVFPPEIGGTHVRLLIGIRNTKLAPVLRLVLPSGLCLHDSKFRDVYGSTLCFGGPHGVFTEGYASAYLRAPRTFIEDQAKVDRSEPVTFEEVEVFGDPKVLRRYPGGG